MSNNLTLSLGVRYDLEILPTPNRDNPMFEGESRRLSDGLEQLLAAAGILRGRWTTQARSARARRRWACSTSARPIRSSRTCSARARGSRTRSSVNFPTNNFDPGPRNGNFPTDPRLVNGPVVDHAPIDALYPPGTLLRNGGTVRFDNPDRKNAYARQYSLGYERQVGAIDGDLSVDLHPLGAAQAVRAQGAESAGPRHDARDEHEPTHDTAHRHQRRLGGQCGHAGERRLHRLQHDSGLGHEALPATGGHARISYAFSRGRGNVPTGQADTADSQFIGELNQDLEYGPTSVDRPHILTLTGSWDVPRTGGLKAERRLSRPQRNAVLAAQHDLRSRSQWSDRE